MGVITKEDLKIIVKGAIIMAQQDGKIVSQERGLINRLITEGRLDSAEFKDFEEPLDEDIAEFSSRLSNKRAKKVFLLTLFTVALADENFADSEKKLLDDLSEKLQVGNLNLVDYTYESSEKEVLELLRLV